MIYYKEEVQIKRKDFILYFRYNEGELWYLA